MYARLTCNPPLGQITTIAPGKEAVRITVLVESSITSQKSWNVSLWHNFEDRDKWTSLSLEPAPVPPSVLRLTHDGTSDIQHQWFTITLTGRPKHSSSFSFTFTFRASNDEPWKWANDQFSTSDGQIIYQSAGLQQKDLTHYISDLPAYLQIGREVSDTPDTLLWSVWSPVNAASGRASGFSNNKLGKPTSFSRWFALVRLWSPWLAPRQGRDEFRPDKEAVLAAFQRGDGTHLVVLALSGVDNVLTCLHHDGAGNITINSRNDSEEDGIARLVISVGNSLENAIAAAVYHARKIVTKYEITCEEISAEMQTLAEGVKPQWLENWYDGLSYCTWNGLGQRLNEQKIFDALDSLQKNEINITNLIIDDNWQSLNHEGGYQFDNAWMEFEATRTGFPRGLQATVKDIRNKHQNIQHVAVWHALFGYWGGIAPEGKIAKEYKTVSVKKKDGVSGGKMLVVAEEDVGRFYKDFYQFLSSAGIDSVKTDGQFFLDELDDASDRRSLIRAYQDAWNINQLRYFSAKAISCMSQTPQIIFHSQLPSNRPRVLLRNSDDFFPEVPASHPWHIFCNAHNSIFNSYLNILPDWDMFQTSHEWASFHAAARCISGGPIYITDVPGKHDVDLINQMTGKTPRGNTVILRPHTVGKSIQAYNSYDDPVLLKVGTYVGMARTGVSILGIFNCTQRALAELIRLDQFPGAETGKYVLRSHTSGQVTDPIDAENQAAFLYLELPTQGWEILSAFPLQSFTLERSHPEKGPSDISISNLGLLGKMTGAAAIVNMDSYIERSSGRLRIWTSLKTLGTYGLYISDLSKRSLKDDFMALISGKPIPAHCVKVNDVCDNVLEIDLARAWKETNSNAGWSNEVAVEVVVR
ncbi:raffinose synthase protein-like protein Sip1 [Lindgomyces ingoldianus]|uniref:Raffinose synthase protein-like protein Sip1 n=1 Tax=Lindgomyces ingoldianus TaxID=673940 RepID=A0ACB6RBC9_9PLEO|nr:raffinose synthase protein-like protein Sip1 [Lindgomyces ingoldianus]KAF2476544.1 raffinose synthase protein-like protein Sip1 [Lindgomyces ingoldianus]